MRNPVVLGGVTIDCVDPKSISNFYINFLGWEKTYEDDGFIFIASPQCDVKIGFQRNPDYIPPVWPETADAQQQMVHLDFKAIDKAEMDEMVACAIRCGARMASEQFSSLWTVMIDPVGHPFCIDTL